MRWTRSSWCSRRRARAASASSSSGRWPNACCARPPVRCSSCRQPCRAARCARSARWRKCWRRSTSTITRLDDARLADRVARASHARLRLLHVVAAGDASRWTVLPQSMATQLEDELGGARASAMEAARQALEQLADVDWRHAGADARSAPKGRLPSRLRASPIVPRSISIVLGLRGVPGLLGTRVGAVAYRVLCAFAGPGARGAARGARRARSRVPGDQPTRAQDEGGDRAARAPWRWRPSAPASPDRAPPANGRAARLATWRRGSRTASAVRAV